MRQIIIDEKGGNPFPSEISVVGFQGGDPSSTEGYHHNPFRVRQSVVGIANLIGLKAGQKSLEVGHGSNIHVSQKLKELGMEAYALDILKWNCGQGLVKPPKFASDVFGFKEYDGAVEDILHPESDLRNELLDLIVFWGSWESGCHNFAIGGEVGEARIRQQNPGRDFTPEQMFEEVEKAKRKTLQDLKSMLNPDGGILNVSSRYAYHGAGFTTRGLPLEKRLSLRLAQTFADMGAGEIYLMGISKECVKENLRNAEEMNRDIESRIRQRAERDVAKGVGLEYSVDDRTKMLMTLYPDLVMVRKPLLDDDVLFSLTRGVYEAKCPDEIVRRIKEMKIPLGRIDALYARF